MKKLFVIAGIMLVMMAIFATVSPNANAGRVGGPTSMVATVPAFESRFFSIPFAAGEAAVVSISGEGKAVVHLILYDGDGHAAMGIGDFDRRTASMDVYRSGTFRVELRNAGSVPSTVVLSTN